jgi:hypothetical protein
MACGQTTKPAYVTSIDVVAGPGVVCDNEPGKQRVYCHISDKADTSTSGAPAAAMTWKKYPNSEDYVLSKWIEEHCTAHFPTEPIIEGSYDGLRLDCGGKGVTGSKVTP